MKISEVSKFFNISGDTLRYYEKIGLIDPVERLENGLRNYSEKDLNRIRFIKCMRQAGLSIESILNYIELFKQGDSTLEERKEILYNEKYKLEKTIANLEETLNYLNNKIKRYEDHIESIKSIEKNM